MSENEEDSFLWESLRERLRPLLFPRNNSIIDLYRNGKLDGQIIEDFELKKIWPDQEMRKDWIKLIKNNSDFELCLESSKNKLHGKRNEAWLKKYHHLYYSLKTDGYRDDFFPIVGIHIGRDCYYRLDGTHRSSCLYDLGYSTIRALIFDLEDITGLFEEVNNEYEEYWLNLSQDYQKSIDSTLDTPFHERYHNLISLTESYTKGKTVVDVGCNTGLLSILLLENNCKMVYGFDINEVEIQVAQILSRRRGLNQNDIKFINDNSDYRLEIIGSSDVVFFIRSIYHLGRGARDILNSMRKGSIAVIECNRSHYSSINNPEKIVPTVGKRLALLENLIPFLNANGFSVLEKHTNVDDLIIARKTV